ncbi:MAG: GTP 3',8-cyclase MoaA [Gemmatimonadales bacterium]
MNKPANLADSATLADREVVTDRLDRNLKSLRVSLIDMCNLRCDYCMPEEEYVWLPRQSLLTHEEMARLVGVFAGVGVERVRITGGEPLLRRNLPRLVALVRQHARIRDIALTTNGVVLARHAAGLAEAGLDRVTVSLDTLREDRFRQFARRGRLGDVLSGLDAAAAVGLRRTKVNTVVVRGFNDDELYDLLLFGQERDVEVRFIEYMDVGGATRWSPEDVVSREEMLERIADRFGPVTPITLEGDGRAPADRFRLDDGTIFGIVASTTAPFCRTCGRSRITADGMWYTCLYADRGADLRGPVRAGASDDELARVITATWAGRTDRGAEQRLAAEGRGPLYRLEMLRTDPHREMHTRGG